MSEPQNDKYRYFLMDLGPLLKEHALKAKERARGAAEDKKDFYDGMLTAYHRVLTLVQQQALGFNISLGELRLEDINPDRDLR
jgi:hypothetical protein